MNLVKLFFLNTLLTSTAFAQLFPSAGEMPPQNWKGKIFTLSQDYPQQLTLSSYQPWMQYDFRKEPLLYMNSVLNYFMEGNTEVDFAVHENRVRKWHHVPWFHWSKPDNGNIGREFIHGLTRERDSHPYELAAEQHNFLQAWAIGMYNDAGGYTVGQVWKDHDNPDPSKAKFPYGTVAGKILFTEADSIIAPYLTGSPEWDVNIHTSVNEKVKKHVRKLRLLQVDIAVRDPRADNASGWVMGTFAYNFNYHNENPWKRLMPVGLTWGNDAGINPENADNGKNLKEVYIYPEAKKMFKLGWAGRLNGPVDNPSSGCISCHGVAQYPMISSPLPSEKASMAERMHWFRKPVKAQEAFTNNAISLDFSLQLAIGIDNFYAHKTLQSKEGNSERWKGRISRFVSGGYIYVFVFLLVLLYIVTKKISSSLRYDTFISLDGALLLLRVGIGIMFMLHGFPKITGGPATWWRLGSSMSNFGVYGYPEWWGFMAAFAEFGGGLLLLLGLFFRPVMIMMCIQMIVAVTKHLQSGDAIDTASHAIEALIVFVFLLVAGSGKFSLDRKIFLEKGR